jgi:hypothetical protein
MFTLALVTHKRNHPGEALDEMQRCYMLYQAKLGEYANKTQEVERTINEITSLLK